VLPSVSGDDFEAFLRRTAEEIIGVVVQEIISEVDRLVFEEEASDVTMKFIYSCLRAKCIFAV